MNHESCPFRAKKNGANSPFLKLFFLRVNVINHILKFLPKFNTTYDYFFSNF